MNEREGNFRRTRILAYIYIYVYNDIDVRVHRFNDERAKFCDFSTKWFFVAHSSAELKQQICLSLHTYTH